MAAVDLLEQAVKVALASIPSAGTLRGEGNFLLSALGLIALTWMGIRIVLESGSITDLMGTFIRSILIMSLMFWVMTPEGFNMVFVEGVDGTMDALASKFLGTGTGTSYAGAVSAGMVKMIESTVIIGDTIYNTWFKDANAFTAILILLQNIFSIMFLALAIVTVFISACIYFAVAVSSMLMVKIAIVLAPILLPWGLLPYTSFIFDGWIKFFITAGLTKVVGALMVAISANVLNGIVFKTTGAFGETLVYAIVASGMGLLIVYLMSQIPNIAQAIISGGAGLSMHHAVRSAGKATSGAPGTAMDVAGTGASGVGKGTSALGAGLSKTGGSAQSGANVLGTSMAIRNMPAGDKVISGGNLTNSVLGGAGDAMQKGGKALQNFGKGLNPSKGGGKNSGGNNNSGGNKTT